MRSSAASIFSRTIRRMRSRARRCASICRISPPRAPTPAGFLLTLALPKGVGEAWLKAFSRALGADAKRYGCPLLGGDTVRTPGPLMVSITAFGVLPAGTMVRRRPCARVGDHVLVSGTIGDAALGLAAAPRPQGRATMEIVGARARPSGAALSAAGAAQRRWRSAVRKYATAAMDVSDGLAGDLGKLCRASGVAAVVDVSRVPLSAAARKASQASSKWLAMALSGGDDYEIVCTVRPQSACGVPSRRARARRAGDRHRAHRPRFRREFPPAQRQGD